MPFSVRITKRLFDILISSLILIVGLPIWILIALAIKIDSKGPVFYIQIRVKRCGNFDFHERCIPTREEDTFRLFKFRTMSVDAEKHSGAVNAGANDSRVTRVGKFLRPTRLDEIPNLINVLLGQMSIVGPRADRMEILGDVLEKFPYIWERTRFVKPGITGLAQLELRSNGDLNGNTEFVRCLPNSDIGQDVCSFRYKMYFDFAYQELLTKFWSFLITDIKILLKTPYIMFIRRNTI